MLKLINHIIKEYKTGCGGSLQVIQFTQNCTRLIATNQNTCILNHSDLFRIGDWATRESWWYQWLYCSCRLRFYRKFQVVRAINSKTDNGKFNYQYIFLGEKRRGNWGYKINAEKNSSKDIKEEWNLYGSSLGKDRYTSLELAVRRWSGLCITGLLWVRLPCSIGIGDKLSWGNLCTTSGRSRALIVPRVKFSFDNPVKVAKSENKKEHSHRLWHCQILSNIVDS
jgi:hypothetical protein